MTSPLPKLDLTYTTGQYLMTQMMFHNEEDADKHLLKQPKEACMLHSVKQRELAVVERLKYISANIYGLDEKKRDFDRVQKTIDLIQELIAELESERKEE